MSESRTLRTAVTSSGVRHFSGHESDSSDGTSVAVDTARVNFVLRCIGCAHEFWSKHNVSSLSMYRSEEFDAIPITSSLCLDVVVSSYLDVVVFRLHRGG